MKNAVNKSLSIIISFMLIFNFFSSLSFNTAFAVEGDADTTISASLDLGGKTVTYNGNVLVKADININGGTLIVNGDLYHASGEIFLNGGKLIISGNYRIQAVQKTSGSVKFIQSTGTLVMDNPADYVKVSGDFYTQSTNAYSENRYPRRNAFSNGVMEILGGFHQISASANKNNFYALNSHKVIFSGTTPQNISFESNTSCFNQLEVKNSNIIWSNHMSVNSFVSDANIIPSDLLIDKVDINAKTVTFNGDVTVEADVRINRGKMVVKGNLLQSNGEMYLNGGTLKVEKDYRIQAKQNNALTGSYDYIQSLGTIVMDEEADLLQVLGDFYTQSTRYYSENRYPQRNALSNGTIELSGNFYQISASANKSNFYSQGNHKVVLNGADTQLISFESSESCFNQLIVQNKNIIWRGHMAVNQLTTDAVIIPDELTVDKLNVNGNTITFTTDFNISGPIDINSGTMNVKGNLYHSGGGLYLNSGKVYIDKDYRIQSRKLDPTTDEYEFTSSSGNLVMDKPEDLLVINGSFYTQSTCSFSETKYYNSNALSEGVMEILGGFYQISTNANQNNFYCKTSHKVVMKGTETQYIYFESSTSCFNQLELINKNIVWSGHLSVNAFVSDATIRPNKLFLDKVNVNGKSVVFLSSITAENDIDINSGIITVKGDLYQTAGEMYMNGGTLHIEGNYRIQNYQLNPSTFLTEYLPSTGNIVMDNDNDLVVVDKSFYTQSTRTYSESRYYQRNALSKGVMQIKGDFYQLSSNAHKLNIYGMGTHKVIFDGENQQKIYFESNEAHFNNIELVNKNVVWSGYMCVNNFVSNASITPDNLLIEKINLNSQSVELNGDVTVENDVDINGGRLTVHGNLYQTAGEMYLNKGALIVDGDYRVQSYTIDSETNELTFDKSTGSVVMAEDSDYIKVGGDFYTQSTRYFHDIHYYQRNTFAKGIMEIKGNFYQISTDANKYNFYAKQSHKVILSGDDKQTVNFESDISNFNILKLTKPKNNYTFNREPCWITLEGLDCNHKYDSGVITKKPTCTVAGEITFTCEICKDTYINIVEPSGHTAVTDKAVSPTCTSTGLTEGSHCSVCNTVIVAQKTLSAKGHRPVTDKSVSPTCTQPGLSGGSHCSVCNEVIVEQKEIPAKGHTEVTDYGYPATETTNGLTDGSHCSVCKEILKKQEIIPATASLIGDVNCDGKINILDATEIQKHLAKMVTLNEQQLIIADTNHDGKINILDATQIQKFLAKLVTKL